MKRRNEDLYGLELLELILADKTKDDDQRIVNFKNYVRQLKTENESLRNQKKLPSNTKSLR
mgnify:CR=1 FL=1